MFAVRSPSQFTKYNSQSRSRYSLPDKVFKLTPQPGSGKDKAMEATVTRTQKEGTRDWTKLRLNSKAMDSRKGPLGSTVCRTGLQLPLAFSEGEKDLQLSFSKTLMAPL